MHAVLSPSGAHWWSRCPGGPAFTAGMADNGSVYADEGTAAHTLATRCFLQKRPAADFHGEKIAVGKRTFEVTSEMAAHVQGFVDYVLRLAEGRQLFVEQRLPIGHITGEPGATGTGDVVILDARAGELWSIDFKYGAGVRVFVEGNEQTQIYGLGALSKFSILCNITSVNIGIYQPRMDHIAMINMPTPDLLRFGSEMQAAALVARQALAMKPEELNDAGFLRPSEKACQWCRGKATCPALRSVVQEFTTGKVTGEDFAEFIKPGPEDGGNYLASAMDAVGLVEDWCKAIRGEVERRLLKGQTVPGYKLVEGKLGDRKWTDEKKVVALLRKFEIANDIIYEKKLIGVPAVEKLLKKTSPRFKEAEALTSRAPGKPSVAPATDPRAALPIQPIADEFRAMIEE